MKGGNPLGRTYKKNERREKKEGKGWRKEGRERVRREKFLLLSW